MTREAASHLKTATYDAAELHGEQQALIGQFQQATTIGFYEDQPDKDCMSTYADLMGAMKLRFSMVFDQQAAPESRHSTEPVHTYGSFPGLLNAGAARPVAVHKITAVTVSPTHRRQGILSRQIVDDLRYAQDQGFSLAALTVSEAGIYGRFGFEPATYQTRFKLKCQDGLKLLVDLPGTVLDIDPERFAPQLDDLMARSFGRTFGSVDGTEHDKGWALGRWEGWDTLSKAKNMRHAAYYDETGELGGFAAYKFGGWDDPDAKMVVHKLMATSDVARLKLLEYIASHDLVRVVHAQGAPDDPLRSVLQDVRDYEVRSVDDVLWLRILDMPAAFEARGYHHEGRLALSVGDRLGLVQGTYLIEAAEGSARVKAVAADAAELAGVARVEMSERELAGLYLGTVSLPQLLAVGRATIQCSDSLEENADLFAVKRAPFTPYAF